MVKTAQSAAEIEKCYNVLAELRPQIRRETFLSLVREMGKEGYRLAFIEVDDQVVAVAGYRVCTNLYMGKHLYVDDLVTSSKNQSQGYGTQLITWLRQEAEKAQCSFFVLDSGVHRGAAHRFYFNQGFTIACFNFSERLK